MAALTIRRLPDETARALRLRAAQNQRSVEAEVRAILADAVNPPGRPGLGSQIAALFEDHPMTEAEWTAFQAAIEEDRANFREPFTFPE